MTLRGASPVIFQASGVTDSTDGTNAPPGSMQALTNLIPDPAARFQYVCRPAAEELTTFSGFSSPGFVSALHVRGTLVFGMIASATNTGKDEPFCYDTETDTFVTITGFTSANTPDSPATSGEWEPPVIAPVGVYLLVTHPGFDGVTYFFGWIDISNLAAPTWSAGNTATNALASRPVSVALFNSRAYFAVANSLVYTDALDPLTVTNAKQVLTLGDSTSITALASAQLNTQYGGVIAALIAFKGASVMYQVTGDQVTNDLAQNAIDVATGTLGPNTITSTPQGLAFMSPQGLRLIDSSGNVTDPIGVQGTGVTIPFRYALVPSRMAAAYNNDVYRITVQNGKALGTPVQEWWYDFSRSLWTGPHTFTASLIHAFSHVEGNAHSSFIVAPVDIVATLWDSHSVPALDSTYVENGTQLSFEWTTTFLPDLLQMSETAVIETTINMSLVSGVDAVSVSAIDEDGTILDTVGIAATGAATIWGSFTWGSALWRGAPNNFKPRQVKWTQPITFRWLQISVTGTSVADYTLGNMFNRVQPLGYLEQNA